MAAHWHTRENSGIRLDEQVQWWHDGERIEHPNIIEAFNCGVQPTDDGRFKLVVGNDWCFIDVAHCAYVVTAVDVATESIPSIRLSDRTAERLVPESLRLDEQGVLTCQVKSGRAQARFSRDAQFELGQLMTQSPQGWQLRLPSQTLLLHHL